MPEIKPPPLRNDCFALPPGVDWTPVDEAKALWRQADAKVYDNNDYEGGLKDAMKGLDLSEIPEEQMLQNRGW